MARANRSSVRPQLELLEDRSVPSGGPQRLEFSEAFGPPSYTAATGPNLFPDGTFFAVQDDEWAAIAFYRPPSSVPAEFNLLDTIDFAALDQPLSVDGFAVFKDLADPAPKVAQARGNGAVPIWFVSTAELQAATADGILTIGELSALPSLRTGTATRYYEQNHIVGIHPVSHLTIMAQGTLDDGGSFSLHGVEVGLELKEVDIVLN